jgi:hypothetical protein
MRFAADYSETLEDPYQECDLGYSSGVHEVPSGFWKIVTRKQIELATCGLRQIKVKIWKFFFCRQQMTWRLVSGMRSRLFQRTCSTEHGKSSNIVWTFSVLQREPTSRSTEVSKKTSRVSLQSTANRMWLAQFVCAPQFFKTPKGLCGHTV